MAKRRDDIRALSAARDIMNGLGMVQAGLLELGASDTLLDSLEDVIARSRSTIKRTVLKWVFEDAEGRA